MYSTLAYQGYGRGLDVAELRVINEWALDGWWPDLVVLIDVPPEVAAQRISDRNLDRFERQDAKFHQRVREGFHRLADDEPERFVVIDGSPPIAEVIDAARDGVRQRLGI